MQELDQSAAVSNLPRQTQTIDLHGDSADVNQPEDDSPPGLRIHQIHASFIGPLPPPYILAQYDKIVPNGAECIFKSFEIQVAHRQDMEQRVIITNTRLQTAGFCAALFLATLTIVGGFWLAVHGLSVVGLAAMISAVGGLA